MARGAQRAAPTKARSGGNDIAPRQAYICFMKITVKTALDPEAGVWYVAESSLAGLNIEAESFDALIEKLPPAIEDLLEAGDGGSGGAKVPVELVASAYRGFQIGSGA